MLEKHGCSVEHESEYNWTLFKGDAKQPVINVPKKGNVLAVNIMMEILDQLEINNKTYFDLLKQMEN